MTADGLKVKRKLMKALKLRFKSIETTYRHFRNNPYSPDYIHRLRVEMRKMRAIINFLKPIIEENVYDLLNGTFRELGKRLSETRDLDALIEGTKNAALEAPKLMNNYAHLFGYLEDERLKQAHLVADRENILLFDKELKNAKNQLKAIEFNLGHTKEKHFEEFIINRYLKKGQQLIKRHKKLDLNNYDEIHELRKQAKKVRYAAVGFKSFLPKDYRKPIKAKAKKIQEDLGIITDAHVSVFILKQHKDKVSSINLKGAFQKLIEHKTMKI